MTWLKAYAVIVSTKLKYSGITTLILSPLTLFLDYFNKSFLHDVEFAVIIAGLIMVDLFMGAYKHIKFRTFDHRQLLFGLMEKVFISFMALITFGPFVYVLKDSSPMMADYFNLTARLLIIIYVTLPTFVNMHYITDGKLPPSRFIQHMRKYNETMDVADLVNKKKNGKLPEDPSKDNGHHTAG